MPDNPKIIDLCDGHKDGRASAFVWVCSLAYAGKHGTDGFIPRWALPRINGRPADAARLVEAGLWKNVSNGWEINDWAEFQESTKETQARAERYRKRAQKAARTRWGDKE